MENKRNEATPNRPEGDRVLDAPFVFADLEEYTKQLKEEDAWGKNDRNGITVFKSDVLTIVLTCLHEEAVVKHKAIDGTFTVQVLEGKIRLNTQEGDLTMKNGQITAFNECVDQSIVALDDSVLLLTVYKP